MSETNSVGSLEMLLEKKGLMSLISSNFSVRASDRLILDTLEAIRWGWLMYHNEEFSRSRGPFQDGRIGSIEISGNRGFYAKIEYIPPNAEQKRNARICVTIPFKPGIDGLQDSNTTELRTISESLEAKGYRIAQTKPYKTSPHPQA